MKFSPLHRLVNRPCHLVPGLRTMFCVSDSLLSLLEQPVSFGPDACVMLRCRPYPCLKYKSSRFSFCRSGGLSSWLRACPWFIEVSAGKHRYSWPNKRLLSPATSFPFHYSPILVSMDCIFPVMLTTDFTYCFILFENCLWNLRLWFWQVCEKITGFKTEAWMYTHENCENCLKKNLTICIHRLTCEGVSWVRCLALRKQKNYDSLGVWKVRGRLACFFGINRRI